MGQVAGLAAGKSVGGRSRKNSAPTGSGGGGEVITGNKVLNLMELCCPDVIQVTKKCEETSSQFVVPNLKKIISLFK